MKIRRMMLCPNCKTIQKYGTICGLCKCPVVDNPQSLDDQDIQIEDFELEQRRHIALLTKPIFKLND